MNIEQVQKSMKYIQYKTRNFTSRIRSMVRDRTLHLPHIFLDAPLMRRREAQSPAWRIRHTLYVNLKKLKKDYTDEIIRETVHEMPQMHTRQCLHRLVDPWDKHLQTSLLRKPVNDIQCDRHIDSKRKKIWNSTCYNEGLTIDSVAEPAPAFACTVIKTVNSKLNSKGSWEKGLYVMYLDNFSATILDAVCEIFNLFLSERARRFHL